MSIVTDNEDVPVKRGKTQPTSALLVRLATRLGVPVGALAGKLSPETVRRTAGSYVETVNPDGTSSYTSRPQILEGPRSR